MSTETDNKPIARWTAPMGKKHENGEYVLARDHESAFAQARRTAEYWKANHLAGNARIAELGELLSNSAIAYSRMEERAYQAEGEREKLRAAIREKARGWKLESTQALPAPCADVDQHPFLDGRRNACAEHSADLLAMLEEGK